MTDDPSSWGEPVGPARCRTCKHWEPGEQPWGCQKGQKVGLCGAVRAKHLGGPERLGLLAVAVGETIYGELMTDVQFGCVLHEGKT